MHRSRLALLVIFGGVAACTTRESSDGSIELSEDRMLAANLQIQPEPPLPLPSVCGASPMAALPAAANKQQAAELARQAYDAEIMGDIKQARSLLLRATELDGTDQSTAYHLGVTSEAVGDRAAAMRAYCRYLALAPTSAESADARQRVTKLAQSQPSVMPDSVGRSAVAKAGPGVARATPGARKKSSSATPRKGKRSGKSKRAASSARDDDLAITGSSDANVVVETAPPASAAADSTPNGAPRTASRTQRRTQNAGVGAVFGAILGAAAGRNAKGAAIGAAAGGILGTMMLRDTRPQGGRAIR